MPMRPPPRSPPFTDYDDLITELSEQFNVFESDGFTRKHPPPSAQAEWTEAEVQMWYASGGMICPVVDPKLRLQAEKMFSAQGSALKSPQQVAAEEVLKEAAEAARKAPYFRLLTARDLAKAKIYRDASLTLGHPARTDDANLFAVDDPILRELERSLPMKPFQKHILQWDDDDETLRKALYGDEGFAHGPSAALRGFDSRFFWDASTLKVVGAVRYSPAACIAWQGDTGGEDPSTFHQADGTRTWMLGQVHGGCIEAVLDELTAEVMKINVAPENVTAEISFKIKLPSQPHVTYRLEAEVTECVPPRCMVAGRILTADGKVIAEATAKMAMMDRMRGEGASQAFVRYEEVPAATAQQYSLQRVYADRKSGGGGGGAGGVCGSGTGGGGTGSSSTTGAVVDVSMGDPDAAAKATTSASGGGENVAATLRQMQALQQRLVTLLQGEYFCDDVEAPPEAFGWSEQRLRDYFENGGA